MGWSPIWVTTFGVVTQVVTDLVVILEFTQFFLNYGRHRFI